jgi:hypothetical protein
MTHGILSQTDVLGTAGRSENDRSDDTTTHLEAMALRSYLDPDESGSDTPRNPAILATAPSEPHSMLTAAKVAFITRTKQRSAHEGNTKLNPSYYSPNPIDERMYGERTGVWRNYDY